MVTIDLPIQDKQRTGIQYMSVFKYSFIASKQCQVLLKIFPVIRGGITGGTAILIKKMSTQVFLIFVSL